MFSDQRIYAWLTMIAFNYTTYDYIDLFTGNIWDNLIAGYKKLTVVGIVYYLTKS